MNIKRTSITYAPSFSLAESVIANSATIKDVDERTKKIDEKLANENAEKEKRKKESEEKLQEFTQKFNSMEAKRFKIDSLYEQGLDIIFKHIIFECYIKSLVLDQSFINENMSLFEAYVSDFIDGNGGIKIVENVNTRLAKDIKKICTETVNKVSNRKLVEAANDAITANDITFDLNEEENKDLANDIDNLSVDQIAELVKDKVVQVVMDEKKTAAKKEEAIKAAEEDIVNNDRIQSEDDLDKEKDSQNQIEAENPTQEFTLFGAMMQRAYKQLLETAEVVPDVTNMNDYDANDDEAKVIDFSDEDEDRKLNKSFKDEDKTDTLADKALAETISQYTMLEVMNTMNLMPLTRQQIKDMAIDIAYDLK